MKTKDIINLLAILESMAYISELMAEEIYKSLDCTNSMFDFYADKFRDISSELYELQKEIIRKDDEK